jgi:hypothetical protein
VYFGCSELERHVAPWLSMAPCYLDGLSILLSIAEDRTCCLQLERA